jgi:hypothetical protein
MLFQTEYLHDIFYDAYDLPLERKREILNRARELSYKVRVDKLDCSVSFARQKTDMSYEEVLKKLDDECHFVVIHRRGYTRDGDGEYGEIGFRAMRGIDYFLWINLTVSDLNTLVNEFNLKPL